MHRKYFNSRNKSGPKPDHVKIDTAWEKAIDKALKKERPKIGWPKLKTKDASKKR